MTARFIHSQSQPGIDARRPPRRHIAGKPGDNRDKLGLPFARALCYEFLELTGAGRSVPGAVAMASVLGMSVMLLVSLTACTVPTLRALRIAPMGALRKEG